MPQPSNEGADEVAEALLIAGRHAAEQYLGRLLPAPRPM
jgi:hypothetical protein